MYDEARLISDMIRYEINDNNGTLYTGFPATVLSYDNQLAKVQPVINMRFTDGDIVKLAPINNVPVIFPSGGGGILSFPLKVGDPVWIQCSMFAFDQFKEAYVTDLVPDTKRMHSITDAVAFPCVFPKNIRMGVSNNNVALTHNKVDPSTKEFQEFLSGMNMLPDGSVEVKNKFNSDITFGADKSITIQNTDSGASVKLLDDGNIEITTAQTVKIQNSGEELISLCSELTQLLIDATVNTVAGPIPLNNKAQIEALKVRLDTLKA